MNDKVDVNMNKELKNKNKILLSFGIIGVLILISIVIGITYSLFYATFVNNTVSGESGNPGNVLSVTVSPTSSTTPGNLSTLLDDSLQETIVGDENGSCVDENGNTVCIVYTISLTNSYSATLYVDGSINFIADRMPNLKWSLGSSASTGFSTYNATSVTTLCNRQAIAAGATINFYIAVWISETGRAQADSGNFSGVITFTGYNSSNSTIEGITSTIIE